MDIGCGMGPVPYYEVYKDRGDREHLRGLGKRCAWNRIAGPFRGPERRHPCHPLSRSRRFDSVLASDMIVCTWNGRDLFVGEFVRVLKPGGKAMFAELAR